MQRLYAAVASLKIPNQSFWLVIFVLCTFEFLRKCSSPLLTSCETMSYFLQKGLFKSSRLSLPIHTSRASWDFHLQLDPCFLPPILALHFRLESPQARGHHLWCLGCERDVVVICGKAVVLQRWILFSIAALRINDMIYNSMFCHGQWTCTFAVPTLSCWYSQTFFDGWFVTMSLTFEICGLWPPTTTGYRGLWSYASILLDEDYFHQFQHPHNQTLNWHRISVSFLLLTCIWLTIHLDDTLWRFLLQIVGLCSSDMASFVV